MRYPPLRPVMLDDIRLSASARPIRLQALRRCEEHFRTRHLAAPAELEAEEELARGSPDARLTQRARGALERWEEWPRLAAGK